MHSELSLWQPHEIEQACGGLAYNLKSCTGVSIDSRTLNVGDLFCAIKGPVTDGHDHVNDALHRGAGGIIVSQDQAAWQDYPRVIVQDTQHALRSLAQFARHRTTAKIIGITGSYGKTSIKDALKQLLNQQTAYVTATQRSFNNHWGVPLTLARLHQRDHFGVFEMGMNHPQELNELSKLVQPQIALINNVGLMHQANFEGIESIAQAKAEIFSGMAASSTVILNQDFGPYSLLKMRAEEFNLNCLSFSCINPTADFYIDKVTANDSGQIIRVMSPQGIIEIELSIVADIWQANSLALLALLYACGYDLNNTKFDFKSLTQSSGRGQIHKVNYLNGQLTVIDESYNAGPDSMKAALFNLSKYPNHPAGQRIAILGDMLELGIQENDIHTGLANLIKELNIDQVHCCGKLMENLHIALPHRQRGQWALTPQKLWQDIVEKINPEDIVMIKGSRGQRAYDGRMAYFVDQLLNLSTEKKI